MLLNEIDAALTAENLNVKLAFCAYTETTWAPETEIIKNPDRFIFEIAPITRSYTESATGKRTGTVPFVRNNITLPKNVDEYMEYVRLWKKAFSGSSYVFEYHFWKHQVFDISGQKLALRVFEDAEAYKALGVEGMFACGSQRSYFPNGYAYYVFARKLYDSELTLEEITEDYYSHAYGEDWKKFYNYLENLERLISFAYLEGECSEDTSISPYYSPKIAEKIKQVPEIIEIGRELIRTHYNSDMRVQTVSVRLLEEHLEYVNCLSKMLYHKAMGDDAAAASASEEVLNLISAREPFTRKYFDMNMHAGYIKEILYSKGVKKAEVLNIEQ
jgi:hypothetical protein